MTTYEESLAALKESLGTLVIADGHDARVEAGSRVLLFASKADLDAAAPFTAEDTAVATLPRSSDWRSGESKTASPEINCLFDAAEVVIAFSDADSLAGFTEATDLGAHLSRVTSVRYVRPNGASFADVIGSTPVEYRSRYVAGLISDAQKRPGARPAAVKTRSQQKVAPTVDVEGARIITPASGDIDAITWLPAAVIRTAEATVWNDLADPTRAQVTMRHDLRVYISGVDGIVRPHMVTDVSDAQLLRPRSFLNRVSGGSSVVPNPGFSNSERKIEAAIREHCPESVVSRLVLTRTGWFEADGQWGYVTPSGRLTSVGLDESVRSALEPMHAPFQFTDPNGLTKEQEMDAAVVALSTMAELGTQDALVGLMGATCYGLSALSGRGRGTGSVPVFCGKRGSGKSHIIRRFYSSFLAPTANGPTLRAHDRPAIHRNAYRGMDSAVVVADDFKSLAYDRRESSEYVRFDGLVRPGYEGSGGGSAKSVRDEEGEWHSDAADPSSPVILIGTEILPQGSLRDISSTLERLFVVDVTYENAFRTGDAAAWDAATADPSNHAHMSAFLRWVATKLDQAGTLAAYRQPWLALEDTERRRLRKQAPAVTPRGAEVAVAPLIGITVWTTYLVEVGAMSEDDRDRFLSLTRQTVTRIAMHHSIALSGGGEPHEVILDAIRSGVAADKLRIGDHDERARSQRIGAVRKVDGQRYVALFPDDIVAFLRRDGRFQDMTRRQLSKDLEPVLTGQPGDDTRRTRKLKFDGQPLDMFVITLSDWGSDPESDAGDNTAA